MTGGGDSMKKARRKQEEAQAKATLQSEIQTLEEQFRAGGSTLAGYGAGGIGLTGSPMAFGSKRASLTAELAKKKSKLEHGSEPKLPSWKPF